MPKIKGSKQRTCDHCGHKYHSVRKKKCPECKDKGFFEIETYIPRTKTYYIAQVKNNKEIKSRDKHSTRAVNKQVKLFRRVDIEILGDVTTKRNHKTYVHDDFSDIAMLGINRAQMTREQIIAILGETFKYGTYTPLVKKQTTDCGVVSGEKCLPDHTGLLGPNPVKPKKPKKIIPDPHGWKQSHSEFSSDLTRNHLFTDKNGNVWEDYTNTEARDWRRTFKRVKAPFVTVNGETFQLTFFGGKKSVRVEVGNGWTESHTIANEPHFNRSGQQHKTEQTRVYSSHSCAIAKHLKQARESGAMIVNDKATRMLELPPTTYDKTETITIEVDDIEGDYDVSIDNTFGERKSYYSLKDSPFYETPKIKDSTPQVIYKKNNWPFWVDSNSSYYDY